MNNPTAIFGCTGGGGEDLQTKAQSVVAFSSKWFRYCLWKIGLECLGGDEYLLPFLRPFASFSNHPVSDPIEDSEGVVELVIHSHLQLKGKRQMQDNQHDFH